MAASSTTDLFALLARLTSSRSSSSKILFLMEPLCPFVAGEFLSLLIPMAPFMEV